MIQQLMRPNPIHDALVPAKAGTQLLDSRLRGNERTSPLGKQRIS